MAFKVAKASGVRVPDMVDHVPSALTIDDVVNGELVGITSGNLVTGATTNIAGIVTADAGASRYAAPTGENYSSTIKDGPDGIKIPFLPVTTTLLIEADFNSGTPVIGVNYDIADENTVDVAGGASLGDGDFRVVNFIKDNDGNITKVLGFFIKPVYFVS